MLGADGPAIKLGLCPSSFLGAEVSALARARIPKLESTYPGKEGGRGE